MTRLQCGGGDCFTSRDYGQIKRQGDKTATVWKGRPSQAGLLAAGGWSSPFSIMADLALQQELGKLLLKRTFYCWRSSDIAENRSEGGVRQK